MTKKHILWQFILLSYLGLFSFGLIDNSRGPVYPEILQGFNVLPSKGSWIFSLSSLAGLVTTLSGNLWLRSFNTIYSLRIFLLFQAMGAFGIGFSAIYGFSFPLLLLASFILGLSSGGIGICTNIMISQSVPKRLRRKTYAGLHAMYGIASLFAPIFLSITSRSDIDWKHHFYLVAFIPLCIFILSFFLNIKKDKHCLKVITQKIKFTHVYKICLIFSLYVASEIIVSSRLVYYLEETYKWDKTSASLYLSIFFFLLLFGRLSFSMISFPGKSYNWLKASLIISLVLFVVGLFIHPIALAVLGLSQSFFFPCAMDWLYEKHGQLADSIMPLIMTIMAITLICMHWAVGLIASFSNIHNAMFLGPVFAVISLGLLFTERPHLPEKKI